MFFLQSVDKLNVCFFFSAFTTGKEFQWFPVELLSFLHGIQHGS